MSTPVRKRPGPRPPWWARPGTPGRRSRRTGPARLLSPGSTWVMRGTLGLGVAVYLVFGILPAVINVAVSLSNYTLLAGSSTSFAGLANYRAMFTTERAGFVPAIEATVIFVVGVTLVQNAVGLLLAHRLQGSRRIDAFLRVLVFVPVVLGVTVVGLVWILIFDPSQGPATSFLGLFGSSSAFFGSGTVAMPLVIGVQVWQNLGFTTLVFIGGLKAIGPELYEAADLDGVSRWSRLARISLPLLAPSMTINVLLAVIGSFTTYNLIYILTDGQYHTDTLGILAFNNAFGSAANLGYGAAVYVALFVLTLLVAVPLVWFLRSRERRIIP